MDRQQSNKEDLKLWTVIHIVSFFAMSIFNLLVLFHSETEVNTDLISLVEFCSLYDPADVVELKLIHKNYHESTVTNSFGFVWAQCLS